MIKKILLTSFLLFPTFSSAKMGGASVMPTSTMFPVVSGILFPSITTAGGVNAAALPLFGKAVALQGAYTRASASDPQEFFAGVATTSKNFGMNLGYIGDSLNNQLTSNGFVGVGAKIDPIAFGVNLREFNFSSNTSPSIDLGMIVGEGKGTTFGFVAYDLNNNAQLDIGVGFGGGKKYNMEVNLLLPRFNSSGGGYTFTAAGTIYAGDRFGLYFKTSYLTKPSTYSHTIGVTGWLTEEISLSVLFTTPRYWTGAITLLF